MQEAHEFILLGGALGLISIVAGAFSTRFNAPILLVFLLLGMVAGEDGPGGIKFNDFEASYLIGSIALAIILFEGGLKTERDMIRSAAIPSLVLATVGVALTAGIVGAAAVWLFSLPWTQALLIGAALAPTDAAAVNTLLRAARVAVPERVTATLELESGFNDPMSVFLTVLLVQAITTPAGVTTWQVVTLFLEEMAGGAAMGLAGGYAMLWLLRRLRFETAILPVVSLTSVLVIFGGAQTVGASGFIAVYLMGVIVAINQIKARRAVVDVTESFAWLAQIALFLLLGLLVTPHRLVPLTLPILAITAVLIVLARPVATFACLLPFGYSARETAFASWVGLRGAVPIYLTIIPVLTGLHNSDALFGAVFGVVIASLILQGWSLAPAASVLGFSKLAPTEQR